MNEKIKRLKLLLTELDSFNIVSDYEIERLKQMIESEYDNALCSNPDSCRNSFLNNIILTKRDDLTGLIKNKSKPRKRQSLFDATVQSFRHDITDELEKIT